MRGGVLLDISYKASVIYPEYTDIWGNCNGMQDVLKLRGKWKSYYSGSNDGITMLWVPSVPLVQVTIPTELRDWVTEIGGTIYVYIRNEKVPFTGPLSSLSSITQSDMEVIFKNKTGTIVEFKLSLKPFA